MQEEKFKTNEEIRLYESKKIIDEQFAKKEHEREMEKLGLQSGLKITEKVSEKAAEAQSAVRVQ
jgi:hypothetical protein